MYKKLSQKVPQKGFINGLNSHFYAIIATS